MVCETGRIGGRCQVLNGPAATGRFPAGGPAIGDSLAIGEGCPKPSYDNFSGEPLWICLAFRPSRSRAW
jgi:hypothetical protein